MKELILASIKECIDRLIQENVRSRPRSLAITKLEEALMWLEKEDE